MKNNSTHTPRDTCLHFFFLCKYRHTKYLFNSEKKGNMKLFLEHSDVIARQTHRIDAMTINHLSSHSKTKNA